jgi:CYTH domain-containing protein
MGIEIERKFLVIGDEWRNISVPELYSQAYLSTTPEQTTRVRIAGNKAYLTIKGKTTGISRKEFEYEIPLEEAKEILSICPHPPVEKYRSKVIWQNKLWEVDEFIGMNKGLIIAEIEIESEDELINLPPWVGEEVSGLLQYYNSYLYKNPYSTWNKE